MNRKARRSAARHEPAKAPPSNADELYAEATRRYVAGKPAEAETLCDAALAVDPGHAGGLHLLGVIALQSGRLDRALELLGRAASAKDDEPMIHYHLGSALAQAGRMEAARTHFERALALAPDTVEFQFGLANAFTVMQEHGRALDALARTLALKPDHADAHFNLGSLLAKLGRMAEAVEHFRTVTALQPDNARAHNNLGFALNETKRYEEAVPALERALAVNSDYPEAKNNLGNTRLGMGAVADAVACYRAALALRPDYPNALNNLGNALCQMGRYDEARTHLERALALEPASPAINSGLGNVLQKLGKWKEAVACYQRAIALRADYGDAWTNLAAAYNDGHLHEQALACCDRALAIAPDNAEAFNNRGIALVALDRFDEAMESYRRALAANPRLAMAHVNIGAAMVERGHAEEALAAFERAIAIEPDRPQFHFCHVLTKRVVEGDPRLAALERLALAKASMADEARIDLHFALAKAYSDVGRQAQAFAELLTGNQFKRRHIEYDEADTLGRFERIARAWPREAIGRWSGMGDPSTRPVFILGMPRSGSTLVEQILASHPAVKAGGELSHFQEAATAVMGPVENFSPAAASDDARADLLGRIAARYLAALESDAPGSPRATDKMPSNFALIGLIHLALPNARIIHTRRNPLDTCLSCFSTLFTAVPYSYDLGELGRYYRAYEGMMRHWREVLPESAFLDLDYEAVVADFETQARRIVDYCGLPWDEACLSFHKNRKPIKTASAVQVRQPLYATSVGRWRNIDPDLLRPLRAALEGKAE